jgi:16S rRNA (uracil1498-N3)-methyltransferase
MAEPPVMLPRFLALDLDPAAGSASLSAEEAHHLMHVLRLRFGDEISVFDGSGREYRARIERISRDGAQLHLLEEISAAPEPAVRLTLAQAVLKGDRMDDVVRDATMMGAIAIEPVVSERTIVRASSLRDGRAADRWRRIAIASAKQCRRAVLPAIGEGTELSEWILQDDAERRLMLVEPSAGVDTQPVSAVAASPPSTASLLVGPEGGWSPAEIESALQAGFVPITLGRRTLRADAVPIVAIAVLQHVWRDL